MTNLLLKTDSYKLSMFKQYPPETTRIYSYIEARGGAFEDSVFFGLQPYLQELSSFRVTQEYIDEAEQVANEHGLPFNREGWEYILTQHKGKLPVVIKAAPEGSVIPIKNVLLTIENTDDKCFWLTTYLETALLRAVWYPTTVASLSHHVRKTLLPYVEKTGTLDHLDFMLHDFGARGVSSYESAMVGGSAHLIPFRGTDNLGTIKYIKDHYNGSNFSYGFSIPAAEHSTVTSWQRGGELHAYRNMLTQFKDGPVSIVVDSYNMYNAIENLLCGELIGLIKTHPKGVVVRVDSGDPKQVVIDALNILADKLGVTTNEKGYKVINNAKVLQGDGIDANDIKIITEAIVNLGYSTDNILYGMGGGLLQKVNRDTMKFAMKCSAAKVEGEWIKVKKEPITDLGKSSKSGRVTLYKKSFGNDYLPDNPTWFSGVEDWPQSALVEVFRDGELKKEYSFEEVRENYNT